MIALRRNPKPPPCHVCKGKGEVNRGSRRARAKHLGPYQTHVVDACPVCAKQSEYEWLVEVERRWLAERGEAA